MGVVNFAGAAALFRQQKQLDLSEPSDLWVRKLPARRRAWTPALPSPCRASSWVARSPTQLGVSIAWAPRARALAQLLQAGLVGRAF